MEKKRKEKRPSSSIKKNKERKKDKLYIPFKLHLENWPLSQSKYYPFISRTYFASYNVVV